MSPRKFQILHRPLFPQGHQKNEEILKSFRKKEAGWAGSGSGKFSRIESHQRIGAKITNHQGPLYQLVHFQLDTGPSLAHPPT